MVSNIRFTNRFVAFWVFGTAMGALCGAFIPNYHYEHFVRRFQGILSPFGGVWEYELWGNFVGIVISIALFGRVGTRFALTFGVGYATAFSVFIFSRSPTSHVPLPTLTGAVLAVLVAVLTAKLISLAVTTEFGQLSVDKRRWRSWSRPTRLSLILGALGTLGLLISVVSWIGIHPYEMVPGFDRPREDELRWAIPGAVITLYGRDGSSIENPIRIRGARGSGEGIPAERYWVATYFPRHQMILQSLFGIPRKKFISTYEVRDVDGSVSSRTDVSYSRSQCFDRIVLMNWLGQKTDVYFEITQFLDCGRNLPVVTEH